MKLSILCSSKAHPLYLRLQEWKENQADSHVVELVEKKSELTGGDILFLIACQEIVNKKDRGAYQSVLVVHESDLPLGRGWSPHIWQILEGKNEVLVTLFEAEDKVDSGAIWAQRKMVLEGHELANEINFILFNITLELMDYAVENFGRISPRAQDNRNATYYPKRQPEDSLIDPQKTIAEQFDLLRVADPTRYPAFINFRGYRYYIRLEKKSGEIER